MGGSDDDVLRGGDGNDLLLDHHGDDRMYGGEGDDTIRADAPDGFNIVQGGIGADVLQLFR